MKKKKVIIFGGGISGLTVAHECIEAGFEVHLYEQRSFFGGKALGFRDDKGFPIEHATRAYVSQYLCFFEIMKRVIVGENLSAFDNFTTIDWVVFSYNQKNTYIPLRYSEGLLKRVWALIKNQRDWGLSWFEILQIFWIPVGFLCRSEERNKDTRWKQSFAEVHFKNKSKKFQEYLETLFNQFVAARCHSISAILDDLLVKLCDFHYNPHNVESLFLFTNGPTNEALIDPWVKHLAKLGVHFHLSSSVEQLTAEKHLVQSAVLKGGEEVEGDAYVLALPYRVTQSLTPFLDLPPNVNLEWSMGFQIYLNEIPDSFPRQKCYVNLQDTPWKILYLMEVPSIWPPLEYPENIQAVISGVITNSYRPGAIYGKSSFACRPEELKEEIFTQLGLQGKSVVSHFKIDPTVQFLHSSEIEKDPKYLKWDRGPIFEDGFCWVFESSIFVQKPGDFKKPISAHTAVRNLFLAGEYLESSFPLPTMERACESGKRCAEKIFETFGLEYPRERYLRPSAPLSWVRKIDSFFYRLMKAMRPR